MNQITFSERFKQNISHQQDLLDLISHLVSEDKFSNCKVHIQDCTRKDCDDNRLMTRINISFQVWKEGESGIGTKWEWVRYRAINFTCSNTCFEKHN